MAKKAADAPLARVVGTVVMAALASVAPNPWNPNKMTARMLASIREGLIKDGWLASHALLVWRTDHKGKKQNLIIDGEHRWRIARELGIVNGPMVFLDGLTRAKAKALTIKLDKKRGEFDDGLLATLVKELNESGEFDDIALELGFDDQEFATLLAAMPADMEAGAGAQQSAESASSSDVDVRDASEVDPDNHTRMVQLFFDKAQHEQWTAAIDRLAKRLGTANVTETALKSVMYADQVLEAHKPTPTKPAKKAKRK